MKKCIMSKTRKEKADGHVIEAKLQKTYSERDKDGNYTGAEVGVYVYEYKGRKRKTRLTSH